LGELGSSYEFDDEMMTVRRRRLGIEELVEVTRFSLLLVYTST
jgi:hypothetical protein